MKPAIAALSVAFLASGRASAQDVGQRTERVVVGEQFKAGGLRRLVWGDNYRDLWTTPVELPVLDLQTFAGGLEVVRRIGHGQTQALALLGQNGVAYTFRPIVKDPVGLLPVELRETLAARMVRDQMSSQHPAGHVIVPPLLEAAGILHNTPQLVIMPDDPALGEFRDDFKRLPGDLEEFTGQPGFGGALEIVDGEEMWKRLDASPSTRVDARAYLAARLFDHLIGDWDRHRGQWRFARLPGTQRWQPIPEDRDQAFVRFQGAAIALLRPSLPLLIQFAERYPSLHGLTFDSWDVDRRLLADLERPAYDEVARELQAKLGDGLIAQAVRRMPAPWFDEVGRDLIAALERRRDELPAQAQRFYAYFSEEVDVCASEQDDRAEIERLPGGDVELRLALASAPETAYYRRRFKNAETDEVRLYLLAGDDRVVASGPRGGITVRVVGGSGADAVDDSAAGGLRVSDAEGQNQVRKGPGTSWDAKRYDPPAPASRGAWMPPRDWGRRTLFPITRLTGSTDYGPVVNVGLKTTGYGFRKHPYADVQTLRASYAGKLNEFRGEYEGRFRLESSRLEVGMRALASGFEIVRFYGFGNETTSAGSDADYRINQDQFSLEPSLLLPLGGRASLMLGAVLKHVITEEHDGSLLAQSRPYGIDDMTQLGATALLRAATTDRAALPTRGFTLEAGAQVYPAVAGLAQAFGAIRGEATAYVTVGATLALRVGGKRLFGTYPYYEAAFLGGAPSLRGLRLQRYAGDGVLHGSAELNLPLTKAFLFVPGQVGLLGVADVGRVYLDGESSRLWHKGFGGGVYFASPKRNNVAGLIVARSEGRTGIYLRLGLALQ